MRKCCKCNRRELRESSISQPVNIPYSTWGSSYARQHTNGYTRLTWIGLTAPVVAGGCTRKISPLHQGLSWFSVVTIISAILVT